MESTLVCILLLILLPLAIVTGLFCVQTGAALAGMRGSKPAETTLPSIAVLVPAHDEEAHIQKTLLSIGSQLSSGDRLVVVADNCTDSTASVAVASGAEVCVRTNTKQIGKGYALDYGMRFLAESPRQVVIIVDADCLVADGAIKMLACRAASTGRPIQAQYLMLSPPDAGLMARVAGFAWLVRNLIRPLGFARLGLPCHLMGAGMAFPWALIASASLANGNLVEDITLGMELAERGSAPEFCPQALVTSYFPRSKKGLTSQRYRWEHGHLDVILHVAPKALWRAIRRRNVPLAALALDLMIPPLALLIMFLGTVLLGAAGMYVLDGAVLPLEMSACLVGLFAGSSIAGWWRYGRHCISVWDLCCAIGYVFWKIPLYLRFIVCKQVRWVRSER
jgi:cellulose synthase/poly-beta-1,6-N-acetylglucosamine synthase-like glycosyltransferase